jgi:hypothetical protein
MSRHRIDEIANPVRTFRGLRQGLDSAEVWMERADGTREPLPHIVRHSPTGFEWGYMGSGPSDLALALCDAATAGRVTSSRVYMAIRDELVAGIQADAWELPATRVLDAIARLTEGDQHRPHRLGFD